MRGLSFRGDVCSVATCKCCNADFHPCSFVQEKGEKLVLEETAFEEIERDFQTVLGELSGDKSLDKFRIEYEKLHAVLKKSYDNEKRLMAKCRELNAEIVVNSAKVATALKVSQDDQTTIAYLKKVSGEEGLCLCVNLASSRLVVKIYMI